MLGARSIDDAPAQVPLRDLWRRFRPYARPYRWWVALALALAVVGPALDTVGLYLFKILIDDVLTPKDFAPFPKLAAYYLGLTLLSGAIGFGGRYLAVWVAERFLTDVRVAVYRHLHSLSLDFFERRPLGDTLSRLTGDVGAIEFLVVSSVTSALNMVIRIVLFGAMMFAINWRLALVSLILAPALWGVGRLFSRPLRNASMRVRESVGAMSTVAEEGIANAALVQAYGRQDAEVDRFHRQNLVNLRNRLRSTRIEAAFGPVTDLLELAGLLAIVGLGAWQLARGAITLGSLMIFMAYFVQLIGPIRGLAGLMTSVASAGAAAQRVDELLRERPGVQAPVHPVVLPPSTGQLALRDVIFTYPSRSEPTLRGISLDVSKGSCLAVVGQSGGGKSTISKLLLAFYAPDRGSVEIDGVTVSSADPDEVRSRFAVVMQETLLFDATVRENLLWAAPDATPEQLERAVEDSDLSTVLARLPDGLDSVVGQRGRQLSGGERQRLAIARAMLRDAPFVILDEPTTGLDEETTTRVLGPLARLIEGRTAVVISHDPAALALADRAVRVADGQIVQEWLPQGADTGAKILSLSDRLDRLRA